MKLKTVVCGVCVGGGGGRGLQKFQIKKNRF